MKLKRESDDVAHTSHVCYVPHHLNAIKISAGVGVAAQSPQRQDFHAEALRSNSGSGWVLGVPLGENIKKSIEIQSKLI